MGKETLPFYSALQRMMTRTEMYWLIITIIIFPDPIRSQRIHGLRGPCRTEEWPSLRGTCKLLRYCPQAISNLRSGIRPTLCHTRFRNPIICCPTEPRISEKKCKEYKNLIQDNVNSPLSLPKLNYYGDNSDYGPKEFKCSVTDPGYRIIGGRDSQAEEFPHMAALGYGRNPASLRYKCGGAIISEKFVITAAHCVLPNSRPTYVLVGDIHLDPKNSNDSRRSVVKVSRIYTHPDYRKSKKYNDIALLRLESRLKFSQAVRPACLPQLDLRHENQAHFYTTGWGRIGFSDQSEILQAVDLTRYDRRECNGYYNNEAERKLRYPQGIIRTQMCAGDRSGIKDTCQGDSGGPLVISGAKIPCLFYMVGITSFGGVVCGFAPGVYTNVQSFLPWIEETVWPLRQAWNWMF